MNLNLESCLERWRLMRSKRQTKKEQFDGNRRYAEELRLKTICKDELEGARKFAEDAREFSIQCKMLRDELFKLEQKLLEQQRLLVYQFGQLGREKEELKKDRDKFKAESRGKKP
jgi:hypothetical protein